MSKGAQPASPPTCPICQAGRPMDVIADLGQIWVTAQPDAPLPGYVCLVSKSHVREPFELPRDERFAFWRDVDAVAEAIAAELRPAKLNYEIHGNTVEHLHLHLFPRYPGDPFQGRPIDPRQGLRRSPAEIDRLRTALARLTAPVGTPPAGSAHAVGVRAQRPEDAEALVDVHLRSWRWAYAGLIPDDYIDLLWSQRAERVERTRRTIAEGGSDERFWLAEREGKVEALAYTHASGDEDAEPGTAELGAIYLVPEAAGQGIGRALLAHAVDDLRARGFQRATLWVLDTNARARRFYEAAGWRPDGATKVEERPGATLSEVRYAIELATEIVAAVIIRGGRLALVRQQGPDDDRASWALPGGRVEAGEDDRAALAREVREETGLELIGQPVPLFNAEGRAQGSRWRARTFRCETTGDLNPADPDRFVLASAWFPVQEAIRLLEESPWYDATSLKAWLATGGTMT